MRHLAAIQVTQCQRVIKKKSRNNGDDGWCCENGEATKQPIDIRFKYCDR